MMKLNTTPSESMVEEAGEIAQIDAYYIDIAIKINGSDVARHLRFDKYEGSNKDTDMCQIQEKISQHAYEIVEQLFKEL